MVLEKTLESPLDYKEIQPVHPKGNQSWILIGRTEAEAEATILWPPDVKSWLEKTLMLGDIEGRRRRGGRGWNDWMVSLTQWTWIEQTMGDGDRQGSLAHCSPWGHKESDMTEWLKNNNPLYTYLCVHTIKVQLIHLFTLLPFHSPTKTVSSSYIPSIYKDTITYNRSKQVTK